jgi:AraC-like DNA-binding protein
MKIATIKARNVYAIAEVLRELDVDVAQVLETVGITPEIFSDPQSTLPYSLVGRLLRECVRVTGCEDFGLRVGVKSDATAMGLTGLVSLNSPTLGEALQVITSSLMTSDTGGEAVLELRDENAILSYVVTAPNVEAADQITDGAIAIACRTMRQLCGSYWHPSRVALTREPPQNARPFLQFFMAPIEYRARAGGLTFPADFLRNQVLNSNPDYLEILSPLLKESAHRAHSDFVSQVKTILRTQSIGGRLTLNRAALELRLSPRTLTRRLRTSGVPFSHLVNQLKFEAAQALLVKNCKCREIAIILGFADAAAFSRAFRSWAGTTPIAIGPRAAHDALGVRTKVPVQPHSQPCDLRREWSGRAPKGESRTALDK